jgi:ABC-type multidrug transport system fused ATPase/permease subunit
VTAPAYRATLTTYLSPLRRKVAWLGLALAGSIGLQIVVPLLLRRFIDAALAGVLVGSLVAIGFAYLVAGVVNQVLSAVATYLGTDIGWRATNVLRRDLTRHLLSLDMGHHTDTTPGEMIERIDGDVTAVSDFIARFVVRLLGSAMLLVGVLVVTTVEDLRLGLAILVYVMAVLTLVLRMRSFAVQAAEEERETSAVFYGFIEERIAGIEDIRANGAGPYTMYRFVDVMRDFYTRTVAAWRRRTVFWVTANTAFWSGDAIALIVGVWLHERGAITVGTAYLILQYTQLVRTPIEQVAQQFQELQKAAGGIVRIDRLREITSRLDESGTDPLPGGPLEVRFDHVTFAYDDRVVLDDVEFVLPAGEVLGLLGRTGGGKTTITRLVSRLYDPIDGRVLVGGGDLRRFDPAGLRRSIGVVSQDVQLFEATVRDNLTFFDPSRTDAELRGTLEQAGLGAWLEGVGLDTMLGPGGRGLSAGEAQLLAFARVFLRDPGLVLLDEPSSRLDPVTEALIEAAAERLFEGRTVMIVAHRLETVQRADRIMVVEGGRIAEYGPRRELAANPASRYARLLAAGQGAELS